MHRKQGRPKYEDPSKRKDKRIAIRVSENERRFYKQMAEAEGMKLATWIKKYLPKPIN